MTLELSQLYLSGSESGPQFHDFRFERLDAFALWLYFGRIRSSRRRRADETELL